MTTSGVDMTNEVVRALRAHLGKAGGTPVAPTVAAPPAPVAPGEGEVWFSRVFGYTPAGGDFPVAVYNSSAARADIARLIPAVDADYVPQKEACALFAASLMDNDRVLLTGPTGAGKSSMVRYVCAMLRRPFIRVNMSRDVESSHIFGTREVSDGSTTWADGPIAEAVRFGAVCLIDEWELMPAEITMGLQNLLEEDGFLYLKEKPGTSADRTYMPAPGFALVCAGNSVGQGDTTGAFSGVAVQNTATIDRFTATIKLDYLTKAHEVDVITSKAGIDAALAGKMVEVAALVRSAYARGAVGLTLSPRTLINWARKTSRYSVKDAFAVAFASKLTDDDRIPVVELYNKVF